MNVIKNFQEFISKHHDFLLRAVFYAYLTIMIVLLIPLSNYYHTIIRTFNWFEWDKTSNFYGDIEQYLAMAGGNYDMVIAPYKFRPLIPFLWSILTPTLSLNHSFLIWNLLFLFGTSLLIDYFLNSLEFGNIYKLLGVLFLFLSFPILQIAYTPNIDTGLLFFSFLFMIGVVKKNPWFLGISLILGVLTKESFLFLIPIYFIYNFREVKIGTIQVFKERSIPDKKLIISIGLMVIAFIEFLAIRGFIFNVNYDFNLLSGEFPVYYKNWLSLNSALDILNRIFFTFTIIWIGPLGYIIHRWKIDKWFIIFLYGLFAIFMTTLLAFWEDIPRVSYFLAPLFLPIFLRFLKDFKFKNTEQEKSNLEE